jgi:hypothetical protein
LAGGAAAADRSEAAQRFGNSLARATTMAPAVNVAKTVDQYNMVVRAINPIESCPASRFVAGQIQVAAGLFSFGESYELLLENTKIATYYAARGSVEISEGIENVKEGFDGNGFPSYSTLDFSAPDISVNFSITSSGN